MPGPIPISKHIVVIGAGITGLQTALYLQDAGYPVTIIAEHAPGDKSGHYASPWAGGQWRSHAKVHEKELQRWDSETYEEWMRMVREGKGPEAGLGAVLSTLYWSSPTSQIDPQIWWRSTVENFSHVPAEKLPEGIQSAVNFKTICINVPRHLDYLLSSFLAASGKLIKARVPTDPGLPGALGSAASLAGSRESDERIIFVNASGLGAKELVPDDTMFPIRGQTVLVKGEAKFAKTMNDNTYVIPRPGSGTTILGGTRESRNWSTETSDEATDAIVQGCKSVVPELLAENGTFEVLSIQCGLRPAREDGPRVEVEVVDGIYKVVHSYGHAGAGYQNAIGSARKIVQLIKRLDFGDEHVDRTLKR